jgi:tetratricopeptide (TPR) repeat protein
MLNAANLAIRFKDEPRARRALDAIDAKGLQLEDLRQLPLYILTRGELLELQGNLPAAEAAYRDAIAADAFDPQAHMYLALVLARQGRFVESRAAADEALALFAPDLQEAKRNEFERVTAALRQRAAQGDR